MGDPLIVALFWVAFLTLNGSWQQWWRPKVRNPNTCWHGNPWSGTRIELSLSQYADDTTKQIVDELGEDVVVLARRSALSKCE